MADVDSSYTRGDTWPPQLLKLEDKKGLVDWEKLKGADKIVVLIRSPTKGLISGEAEAIDPTLEASEGYNLELAWGAGDLGEKASVASDYAAQTKVYWDESSSPPKVQTFPNPRSSPQPTFALGESNE